MCGGRCRRRRAEGDRDEEEVRARGRGRRSSFPSHASRRLSSSPTSSWYPPRRPLDLPLSLAPSSSPSSRPPRAPLFMRPFGSFPSLLVQ
ncbi:uncharacterized protein RHOBADRAFT_66458 [Rhodotorula graminis WP1]|uniref:Uncharacterized protein n=1 Tax=Rhodotorula graminis (strain WP1) TaxID=578459 RepID=A0A194S1Z4_RHOGW|nr:uncharacterized protein RHOBADRAFT_66458 [Rhodotorula graminis WP1]KPV74622.1 hypothetical protein RHOBADRAFT_66458 [Rhodotorula graminis WP1]